MTTLLIPEMTYSYFVDRAHTSHAQARFDSDQLFETREAVLLELERLDSEGEIDWKEMGVLCEDAEDPVVERDGETL